MFTVLFLYSSVISFNNSREDVEEEPHSQNSLKWDQEEM